MKHTCGPWQFGTEFDYTIVKPNYDSGERIICEYLVSKESEVEDLANARLIALAPDLLEALRKIHHHATNCWDTNCDEASEVLKQVGEVLARAKGEL